MQEVKKIGVWSTAKIFLLAGIFFGLIMGILIAIVSSLVPSDQLAQTGLPSFFSGWTAIAVLPIFYGILYFIVGLIGAAVYNLFARMVGGIKIELVAKK